MLRVVCNRHALVVNHLRPDCVVPSLSADSSLHMSATSRCNLLRDRRLHHVAVIPCFGTCCMMADLRRLKSVAWRLIQGALKVLHGAYFKAP